MRVMRETFETGARRSHMRRYRLLTVAISTSSARVHDQCEISRAFSGVAYYYY